MPKTRVDFWREKFDRNVARDACAVAELEAAGWRVEVVWECETRKPAELAARLGAVFDLGPNSRKTFAHVSVDANQGDDRRG